jgi:hypothetical protein
MSGDVSMDLYHLVVLNKEGKIRVEPVTEDDLPYSFTGEQIITIRSESQAGEAAEIAYWCQHAIDLYAELNPQARITYAVDSDGLVSPTAAASFLGAIEDAIGSGG